ncbi:MAG: hypothetical protein K6G75_02425 [Lachnospiraceae bacterium]|nr:hypothetical protein [Lachnospiraceae bacterium]
MDNSEYLSKEKFIKETVRFSGISEDELLKKGVLKTGDFLDKNELIDRKNVARILHNYLRIVLKEKDEEDISKAYILKDLFDCRVCANHIAQVYLKGIMDAENLNGLVIFDVFGKVREDETEDYFRKIGKFIK